MATVALLAACNLMSTTPSVEPGASAQPEASECSPVDLRAPSGSRVALTGSWRSNDHGVYDIYQRGSCVFWLGMSQDPGSQPGSNWTNVLVGTVRNDFTIVGRWGDVPFNPSITTDNLFYGRVTIRIEFEQSAEVERPMLRATGGDLFGLVWVREESLPAPIDLQGTFGGTVSSTVGDDLACPWIESNGEHYELIGSAEWRIRTSPLSIQDQGGHIVARIGDPIRVSGRVAPALGSSCTDTAILVEELEPTP